MMMIWERTTHCLVLNKLAAKKLLKYFNNIPDFPVDTILVMIGSYTNLIKCYDYFPHLCYSPLVNSDSDIK